jgi:O-antigen ligase
MTAAPQLERLHPSIAAALFGAWAATIALTPDLAWKAALTLPALVVPVAWWTILLPGRWISLFLATALLLPPLPIAMGDSGPHVCVVFAALGLLATAFRAREWRLDLAGPGVALLALLGALLVSVSAAAWYSGAEAALGSLVRVGLFGIAVWLYFSPRDGALGIRPLYWIAVASAAFACVDFYYQFPAPAGFGPQYVWLDSGVYRRAQGFFYEASTLGNFCAFFVVMIAVALARPRAEAPVSRKALAAGGVFFFAALVLSYSRGSLICVAVALAMLAWQNRRRLRFGRLAIGMAAAAAVTSQVFPVFAEVYWLRLSASAEFLFSATNGVLSGRVASWSSLGAWISTHPWQTIFGVGYKTLPYTEHLGARVVADNMYLSLLVETGVIGLAALVWLNVAILRAATKASRSADARRAFCGSWMLCFWAGEIVQMASGDLLTYWRVLPVYFLVLSMAVRG